MVYRAAFFSNKYRAGGESFIDHVYAHGRREKIASLLETYPVVIDNDNFDEHASALKELEVIFSTWNMPVLEEEQISVLENLRAVFYAAGSVAYFAKAYLNRGVMVFDGKQANARSVAEFALGQILLSAKGYFRNSYDYTQLRRERNLAFEGRGIFNETVALLGAGAVGRCLIELLKPFDVKIMVVDPYLSPEEAEKLGVTVVKLEDAFRNAYVISNHMPDLPPIRGILNRYLFASMRHGATFVNTGRGAQVNEKDLVDVLRQRTDLTALLDVTHPEPPAGDSDLFSVPNLIISSHIAGAMNNDVVRLADSAINQYEGWVRGETPPGMVTLESLATSA